MSNYSLLKLSPNDEKDRELFWEFRVNEMWNQFKVWSLICIVGVFATIVVLMTDNSLNAKLDCINMSTSFAATLIVYLISKRWKHLFVYLIPVMLIASFTGMLIKIFVM